jgi:translation initiation factor 1
MKRKYPSRAAAAATARTRLVYTSGSVAHCPGCQRLTSACVCAGPRAAPPRPSVVRVARETSGRSGKAVTVITGLALAAAELDSLATLLKRRCGAGGTVREDRIEIQGEHRDRLVAELSARGYTVKRAGG